MALTALLLAAGLTRPAALAQDDFRRRADALMQVFVGRDKFSGSVLVAQNGEVLFEKGYGLANRETDAPNTPLTKFRIASLTKQFTAAAVLILQERGRLKVTDAVSRHVAELPPGWRAITIHQLLTHTSGLPEFTAPPEVEQTLNLTGASPEQLLGLVRRQPLGSTPGTKLVYCNTGYLLLGMVIEKASGLDYASFLRQSIFTPLGLNDTGYDVRSDILRGRADGYRVENGRPSKAGYVDASIPFAAGGLYSTVRDLYRWNEALAAGRLLSDDSRRRMFTVYPEAAGYGAHYGYGVVISEKFGQPLYYHGGGIKGFASAIQRYPESKICVVVLSNEEEIKSWDVATSLAGPLLGEKIGVRNAHAMAYDGNRGRVILFGGADASKVAGDTWEWDGKKWSRISVAGPGPRTFPAMAYDQRRRRVVLFGGNRVLFGAGPEESEFLDDTWEWDGRRWKQLKVAGPPPRAEAAMAYDGRRGRVVLFGGHNRTAVGRNWLGDTWEWDGRRWIEIKAAGPSPRNSAALAYDGARGKIVLFGGASRGVVSGETWEYDGRRWVENRAALTEGRFNCAMAYDGARGRVIRFGGRFSGKPVGDTWEYDGNAWKQLSSAGPAARNHTAAAYDPQRKKIVLFGGHDIGTNDPANVFGDTWEWGGSGWTLAEPGEVQKRINDTH